MQQFKTESQKLLNLMINSIYTNQEIFLRELISNASDAVDKLYFKSLTDSDVSFGKDELRIEVSFDKDARTITVSDTGIGMNASELEENLGTIAHSGSMEFKGDNSESQGDAVDIIGQFGVGFYSAFMVAKRVKVVSKAFGSDTANVWESDGIEGYTIEPCEKATQGTDVILLLKDDTDNERYSDYLNEDKLQTLIRKYSNYIRYPIRMEVSKTRALPKPEDAGEDYATQYEQYKEVDTINSMTPIWKKKEEDLEPKDYNEFYKSEFHDFFEPARRFSIHAEGTLEYDALLYIPSKAPYDFYSADYKRGLALYSSGVLIMDKCEELLPDCFGFVCGVVDSQDITLNISRETLQSNRQLRAMAKKIEKKVKAELIDMRDNDREKYEEVFKAFGRSFKYGIYADYGAKKELLNDLLMFYSAKEGKMVTLDEYLSAAPSDQEAIYYLPGDSTENMAKMPIVRTVLDKGYDVLLCTEDIDDFSLMMLGDYNEKELKNVTSGDLGLETEDERAEAEQLSKDNEDLFVAMKNHLGEKVSYVSVSTRLTDDIAAALTTVGPISLGMEKALAGTPESAGLKSERVLEINTKNPIFGTLQAAHAEGDADKLNLYTSLLYNQALLVEGLPVDDPVAFAQNICKLMQ